MLPLTTTGAPGRSQSSRTATIIATAARLAAASAASS
jgi:hypothetical protein